MISEIIISKAIDEVYKALKKSLTTKNKKIISTIEDVQACIFQHIKSVENWSSEINFRDLSSPKILNDTYIDLYLTLTPKRLNFKSNSRESKDLKQILDEKISNLVILGQPGAGKTTTMKHICQEVMYEENSIFSSFNFPIALRLRELTNYKNIDSPLIKKLYNELGLSIDFSTTKDKDTINHFVETIVLQTIDELNIILILDGLDEISDESLRHLVVEDIKTLSLGLSKSLLILTSRTADFNIKIENTSEYEIDSLTDSQIFQFAEKWLKSRESAERLINLLRKSPFYDTTIRPLTLSHLCAIYERDGQIPEKPKSVYRKIINLLLEEWNRQKSVLKKSRYANFEIDRKFEFLCHLAYFLTVEFNKTIFTKEELSFCYKIISSYFELPEDELNYVVDELESHNGIFLQSSYETYEFAHKSLQEYLAAEFIIRLPKIPAEKNILLGIPNELALAIALSSDSTKYFITLFEERLLNYLEPVEFINVFANRLFLEKPYFRVDSGLGMVMLRLYTIYTDLLSNTSEEEYEKFLTSFKTLLGNTSLFYSINLLVSKEKGTPLTYKIANRLYRLDTEYSDEQKNLRFILKKREEHLNDGIVPRYIYYNPQLFDV